MQAGVIIQIGILFFFVYQKTFNYLCKDDYLIRIIKFVEQNGISQINLIAWREFRTEKDTYI